MSAYDPKRTSADIAVSRFLRDITGFGGTKSQAAVINITPTPSETMWQAVFTPDLLGVRVQDSDSLSVWHRANGISGLPL
jgi:O-glycosyl hydrolase